VVSWKDEGSDLRKLYGAVSLEIIIPDDATVFAFSFLTTPLPVPTGVRIGATAKQGAQPGQTKYGGGDYTMAWDGNILTFYDYYQANGGYTEAQLDHEATVASLRYFPRSQLLDRYVNGTFVGYTAAGKEVLLATIKENPSLRWQLLNVSATTRVTSVRYNAPDGGFGNMAEIEVYVRR